MQILFKEFLGRPKERQKQEHKKKSKPLTSTTTANIKHSPTQPDQHKTSH